MFAANQEFQLDNVLSAPARLSFADVNLEEAWPPFQAKLASNKELRLQPQNIICFPRTLTHFYIILDALQSRNITSYSTSPRGCVAIQKHLTLHPVIRETLTGLFRPAD